MSISIRSFTPTMRENHRLAEIIYNWFIRNGGGGGIVSEIVRENGKTFQVEHLREVMGRLDGKEYFFKLGDQPLPYTPYNPTAPRILIKTPDDFIKWAESFQ